MTNVWTDDNGIKRYHDSRGWCWRWDAWANDKAGGWVRDAKFDLPDGAH